MEYVITLPRLRIDGLWYGSPYIELVDSSSIIGEGLASLIEYKGKGYFSGKSHSFKATVTPATPDAPAAPATTSGGGLGSWVGYGSSSKSGSTASLSIKEHVIEGAWHETSAWVKGAGKGKFHDSAVGKEAFVVVGGEADGVMGEFETRNLWNLVAKGIREGDFELASKEKTRIEVGLGIIFIWACSDGDPRRTTKGREERTSKLRIPSGSSSTSSMSTTMLHVRHTAMNLDQVANGYHRRTIGQTCQGCPSHR